MTSSASRTNHHGSRAQRASEPVTATTRPTSSSGRRYDGASSENALHESVVTHTVAAATSACRNGAQAVSRMRTSHPPHASYRAQLLPGAVDPVLRRERDGPPALLEQPAGGSARGLPGGAPRVDVEADRQ